MKNKIKNEKNDITIVASESTENSNDKRLVPLFLEDPNDEAENRKYVDTLFCLEKDQVILSKTDVDNDGFLAPKVIYKADAVLTFITLYNDLVANYLKTNSTMYNSENEWIINYPSRDINFYLTFNDEYPFSKIMSMKEAEKIYYAFSIVFGSEEIDGYNSDNRVEALRECMTELDIPTYPDRFYVYKNNAFQNYIYTGFNLSTFLVYMAIEFTMRSIDDFKICKNCGKAFKKRTRNTEKFCSDNCRKQFHLNKANTSNPFERKYLSKSKMVLDDAKKLSNFYDYQYTPAWDEDFDNEITYVFPICGEWRNRVKERLNKENSFYNKYLLKLNKYERFKLEKNKDYENYPEIIDRVEKFSKFLKDEWIEVQKTYKGRLVEKKSRRRK